jgi:peptidyl-prolyl cis-trans isomerase SurA
MMMSFKQSISTLALALFVAAPIFSYAADGISSAGTVTSEPVDAIAALVEDDVILRSELAGALINIRRQYAGKEDQLPPQNVLEKQLLERLIVGKLQVLRAQETGVQVTDTEVDQAVTRVASGNKMSSEQLAAALEQDGLRLSDFRSTMRDELLTQKLRQRVAQSRSDVSESEIDILLASGQLKQGEIKLAQILVALPDNATNDQLELAKKKIEGVKKLVDDGKMEFSAAAIRYSDAEQALDGGTIGWRRYDQIPAAFADALAGLKTGEVSHAIRSQSGLHILKVLETKTDSQVMVTEFSASHIMVKVDELTSDAQAEKTVQGIAESVAGGADFAEQAKKYSDDAQTAALGGDMGWFDLQTYGTTYAETISALKDSEVSKPFRTEEGWHIVKRVGTRELDRTKDFARNQARDSIRERKSEEAFQQFIRQLRNESFVELRLEGTPADDLELDDEAEKALEDEQARQKRDEQRKAEAAAENQG